MLLNLIAQLLAYRPIAHWLIRRALRTPYVHLDGYMNRYWLFNPYDHITRETKYAWIPWSVRIHHILREDRGEHLHDHPWNARTFILKGGYSEIRQDSVSEHIMLAGDTRAIKYGEYHRITRVTEGGVWTLFVTGRYRGTWGFLVGNHKVQHGEYHDKR